MLDTILAFPLTELIRATGYAGIAVMVFCESGLPFGFIFPGDSLLFVSGLFASQGYFDIRILVPLVVVVAIAGDSVGYWLGRKIGPRLFTQEDSFWFNKKYLRKTEEFYTKYGARALIFARFLPVVRVFAALLAGVGLMPYRRFIIYNVIGGVLWGAGVTLAGYLLGATVPNAEAYILPIILAVIILSLMPLAWQLFKKKKT